MPSINCSKTDLLNLIGQKLDEPQLKKLLDFAKAELDSPFGEEIILKFNDTNQPYLWSAEGTARLIKQYLGKKITAPKFKKSKEVVKVDKKLKSVRPFIACCIAKGAPISDVALKQLIQLQEKLADNFGRKREKVSIGVYPLEKVNFPISFKAASKSDSFKPLGFAQKLSLKEVVEKHPKGKMYGYLIKDVYPVLIDGKKEILGLAPIINSEDSGKVVAGCSSLLVDVTGTDERAVNLAMNIVAYALSDRGFAIEQLTIDYGGKKLVTPSFESESQKVSPEDVEKLLGIKVSPSQLKSLLNKMGVDFVSGKAVIPCYRNDVMHSVDVVEDVAIAYGYDSFEPLPMTSYTKGSLLPIQPFVDLQRTLLVGHGFQEVMSAVLSNKDVLYDKMNIADTGTIEVENVMSSTYSCLRTWILPILMEVLAKNRHIDYPQKLFEEGLVTQNKKSVFDENHISAVIANSSATFTEMKQVVESILKSSGIDYSIDELELGCFISGRSAQVLVNGVSVGVFGEIHPKVLGNFGLQMPVVGCELNLSLLKK